MLGLPSKNWTYIPSLFAETHIEIVIINKGEQPSFEEELTRDVMEIMTVFCAKLYGRRSQKSKKMAQEIDKIVNDEQLQMQFNFGSNNAPTPEDRTESE